MLGIHIDGATAEGWFGKSKASALLSIAVLLVIILGFIVGGIVVTLSVTSDRESPALSREERSLIQERLGISEERLTELDRQAAALERSLKPLTEEPKSAAVASAVPVVKTEGKLVYDDKTKIFYIETPSAKGNIKFQGVVVENNGDVHLNFLNISDKPLLMVGEIQWKDTAGNILDRDGNYGHFNPGEKDEINTGLQGDAIIVISVKTELWQK